MAPTSTFTFDFSGDDIDTSSTTNTYYNSNSRTNSASTEASFVTAMMSPPTPTIEISCPPMEEARPPPVVGVRRGDVREMVGFWIFFFVLSELSLGCLRLETRITKLCVMELGDFI